MKKLLTVYVSILIAVFLLFSALDKKSDFVVEMKLWPIHQAYAEMSKDPTVVPDQTFDSITRRYQDIIKAYPDSSLTKNVDLLIGEIFSLRKDYDTSRDIYQKVLNKYTSDIEFSAQVVAKIGQTYESEGSWDKAASTYQSIIASYPLTVIGLKMPIYIASHFKEVNDHKNTMKYYAEAIQFYQKVAVENVKTDYEFESLRYLANCYLDLKRWQDALNTLADTLIKFPTAKHLTVQRADLIVKTINIVAAYQLDDYDLAIKIYENFISQYPEHPLSPHLKKNIAAFNVLKEKGIKVKVNE